MSRADTAGIQVPSRGREEGRLRRPLTTHTLTQMIMIIKNKMIKMQISPSRLFTVTTQCFWLGNVIQILFTLDIVHKKWTMSTWNTSYPRWTSVYRERGCGCRVYTAPSLGQCSNAYRISLGCTGMIQRGMGSYSAKLQKSIEISTDTSERNWT